MFQKYVSEPSGAVSLKHLKNGGFDSARAIITLKRRLFEFIQNKDWIDMVAFSNAFCEQPRSRIFPASLHARQDEPCTCGRHWDRFHA